MELSNIPVIKSNNSSEKQSAVKDVSSKILTESLMLLKQNKLRNTEIGLMENIFLFGKSFKSIEDAFGTKMAFEEFIGKEVLISSKKWELNKLSDFNLDGFCIISLFDVSVDYVTDDVNGFMFGVEPPLKIKSVAFIVTDEEFSKIDMLKPKKILVSGVLNVIHNPIQKCPFIVQLHRFL